MSTNKKSKYNYKGYWWALSVIGLSSFLTTGFYINALVNNSNSQNWLSVLVGILWGLCFSVLTAFLIKCSDDKRYGNAQKNFVKNLHDYYLKDFRQALKNYAMYYVNAFKPSPANYKVFKNIQKDNQIDVDALIYNYLPYNT